jgi:hypothetical protein
MLDVVNLNPAEAAFQYQWKGVPRWIVAWQNKLIVYPTDVSSFQTTTLTKAITSESTTIEVDDASNFLQFSGFIQIGDEKIGYLSMSDNVFYGCERGVQDTTAVSHSIGSEVKENNFWVYYYKRHFRIPVINNVISQKTLDMEMEVCDEHMEIITSYTASVLLAKIDPIRTAVYDKTFAEALVMAKAQVRRGRKMINPNGDIRNPIFFETNNPGIYLT